MRQDSAATDLRPDSAYFALPVTPPGNDNMLRDPGPPGDPSEDCDRRRRIRADVVARLLDKAAHLPARDRALLELVVRDGRSCTQLAQVRQQPSQEPPLPSPILPPGLSRTATSLRRRVRRLMRRVQSREFSFVIAHRSEWTRSMCNVATACYIDGLSTRAAARRLRMSLHEVRRHRAAILALVQVASRPACRPSGHAA